MNYNNHNMNSNTIIIYLAIVIVILIVIVIFITIMIILYNNIIVGEARRLVVGVDAVLVHLVRRTHTHTYIYIYIYIYIYVYMYTHTLRPTTVQMCRSLPFSAQSVGRKRATSSIIVYTSRFVRVILAQGPC